MEIVKDILRANNSLRVAAVEYYTYSGSRERIGVYDLDSVDSEVPEYAPVLDYDLMDAYDYCEAFPYSPELFGLDEDATAEDIFNAIYGMPDAKVLVIVLYKGWEKCYYRLGHLYPSKEHYDMIVKEAQSSASVEELEDTINDGYFDGYSWLDNSDMEIDAWAINSVWDYTHKLKHMRTKLGMTQSEFANLLEVPFRTIQNWETFQSLPPEYVYTMALDRVYRATQLQDLEFMSRCVSGYNRDMFSPIIEKAGGNLSKLAKLIVASKDEAIRHSQAYAVASKKINPDGKHWYRVRELMGDKCRKTESDAGALKVGNEGFHYMIGNGVGDGTTRYAIMKSGTFNRDMLNYEGRIEGGAINIYDYDCGNTVKETIKGTFGVYVYEGLIILEESSEPQM